MKLISSTFSCLEFLYSEVVYCFELHSDKLSWLLLSWKKRLLSSTHWQLFNYALLTEVIILVGMPEWRDFFSHQNYPRQETLTSQCFNQLKTLRHNQKSHNTHIYVGDLEDQESRTYTTNIVSVSLKAAIKHPYSEPFQGKQGWRKEVREKTLWHKIGTAKLLGEFISVISPLRVCSVFCETSIKWRFMQKKIKCNL